MNLKQLEKDGVIDLGFQIISVSLLLIFIGLKLVLQHGDKIGFHNLPSDRFKFIGSGGRSGKSLKNDSTVETNVPVKTEQPTEEE